MIEAGINPIGGLLILAIVFAILATRAEAWHTWVSASLLNWSVAVAFEFLSLVALVVVVTTKAEVLVVQGVSLLTVCGIFMHMLYHIVKDGIVHKVKTALAKE